MTVLKIPYTEIPSTACEAFPEEKIKYIPTVLTTLEHKRMVSPFLFRSIIDSGADNCIFPAIYGRMLNMQVEAGKKYPYFGATGSGLAYFHHLKVWIEIEKKPHSFEGYCGFADALTEVGYGLLGRHGFFDLFRSVKFSQNEKLVELELKNEST